MDQEQGFLIRKKKCQKDYPQDLSGLLRRTGQVNLTISVIMSFNVLPRACRITVIANQRVLGVNLNILGGIGTCQLPFSSNEGKVSWWGTHPHISYLRNILELYM